MNNIPAPCPATSISRFLKSRSFSEPKDTKIRAGKCWDSLYHVVENVVNRAVKILFRDLVDKMSRNIHHWKAKVDTSSII